MGNVDLFHSRRTNHFKCRYWLRDERAQSGSGSSWVLNKQPSGVFYAKPVSSNRNDMMQINNMWAFDGNHINIETDDDIRDMTRGAVVEYDGKRWIVEVVTARVHTNQSEYSRHTSFKYTMILRKG